jgi:hypothetical protein
MVRINLEEEFEDTIPPRVSDEYPHGYSEYWRGSGTSADPAIGRTLPIPELGKHAIGIAQSRERDFYFQIEGQNFRVVVSGDIEQASGGQQQERRSAIFSLLNEKI